MKLGNVCHISTIPRDVSPLDIALGIHLIANGNEMTTEIDEVEKYTVLLDEGQLEQSEMNDLHPNISSRCSDSVYRKFSEAYINKSQSEALDKGEIIFLESKPSSRSCPVQVK